MSEHQKTELEEKLKIWFPNIVTKDSVSPTQAAAYVIALQRDIETENWGEGNGAYRRNTLAACYTLNSLLHQVDSFNKNNRPDYELIEKQHEFLRTRPAQVQELLYKLDNRPELFWDNTSNPPKILKQVQRQFNKISTDKFNDFLKHSEQASKEIADYTYYDIHEKVKKASEAAEPNLARNIDKQLGDINFALNMARHHKSAAENYSLTLENGPQSTYELFLAINMYIALTFSGADFLETDAVMSDSTEIEFFDNPYSTFGQNVFRLRDIAKSMMDDLPSAHLRNSLERDLDVVRNVIDKRSIKNQMDIIGFARYFVAHNQEKIPAKTAAQLDDCVQQMYFTLLQEGVRGNPLRGNYNDSEYMDTVLDYASESLWSEYASRTPDEVFENTMDAIEAYYDDVGRPDLTQEKQARFEEMLSETPEGMEDVVLLHYQENEEIRKIRKGAFRSQKAKFLKDLAVQYEDDLVDAGFSDDDIARMREKGKLPSGSDWTVEHIVDRDHGGTNHWHNFVLMSDEINTLKDTLKKIQTYVQPDADQGCWIRSWAPKKLPDGTYPKIVTSYDTHAQEPEIELSPA